MEAPAKSKYLFCNGVFFTFFGFRVQQISWPRKKISRGSNVSCFRNTQKFLYLNLVGFDGKIFDTILLPINKKIYVSFLSITKLINLVLMKHSCFYN